MGHATLTTEQLANDALDSTAAEDGERVASVGSDNEILWCDTSFKTDRNRFLYVRYARETDGRWITPVKLRANCD